MTDLKISQLSAAVTPLTGAELVEVVQGGANAQTTVAQISPVSLSIIAARPTANFTAAHLQPNNLLTPIFGKNFRGCVFGGSINNFGDFTNSGGGNSSAGTFAAPAGKLAGRVLGRVFTSGAGINNSTGVIDSAGNLQDVRRASGLSVAGGLWMWTRLWNPGAANSVNQNTACTMFIGFAPSNYSTNIGAGGFSTLVNVMGIGKDTGDTNIFFIGNAGSGTITKVDTGFSYAGTKDDLFDLYLYSAWDSDTVTMLLIDNDTGVSATTTFSVLAGMPATNTKLIWQALINNGPSSSAQSMVAVHQVLILKDF